MKSRPQRFFPIQIFVTILIIIGCALFYTGQMRSSAEEKALNTLSEISAQSVNLLNKEIEKEEKVLLNLANLITSEGHTDLEAIAESLIPVDHKNAFKRMGIIAPDGTAYTTDHAEMNLAGRSYFMESMAGSCSISDTMSDFTDEKSITVYSVPLTYDGTVRGVLFATYATTSYEPLLSATTFGGAGYSYVVKADGTCMIESPHSDGLIINENLFTHLENASMMNSPAIETLRGHLKQGQKGSVIYHSTEQKYLYYEPLGINDWYLISVVPVSVVQRDVNGSLMMSYIFTIVCATLLVGLLFHIFLARDRARKELERLAFCDRVTGGFTYEWFRSQLPEAYRQASASAQTGCAIVCMNVERFRLVNDMYGYEEGDNALRHLWTILNDSLEEGELMARQTGDHFILFLRYATLTGLKERLLTLYREVNSTHYFQGRYYELKPCFGIYEIKEQELTDQMSDRAKLAIESIKYDLFTHIAVYDDILRQEQLNQKELENHFEEAIEKEEFLVYYQAKYDAKKEQYEGAEALVRWDSSHKGFLSPAVFIPLFERNGSIIRLDTYLFDHVCRQLRQWLDAGLDSGPVSVNLSRIHLFQADFVDEYLSIMKRHRIPARLVQIEITETALFDNDEEMIALLNRLRAHGILILMDDFGSGYSSIMMLKNIPIDILKVDKGLIDDLETSANARTIAQSIIRLSHELGLSVVAEGVETRMQAELLKAYGCDVIQGYYYSRPLPARQFIQLMKPQPEPPAPHTAPSSPTPPGC